MARVVGHVVSTIKYPSFKDHKLLVVVPVDSRGRASEGSFLAADICQAGIGDHVLILQEGGSIRSLLDDPKSAVEALAVGVIDYVESSGRQSVLAKPQEGGR
jgi:ethanolamine utilization protein EutN